MKDEYSYFKKIQTYYKSRWKNKQLIDILVAEYNRKTREYYVDAISQGCILINSKKTTCEYIMKDHDILMHIIHCHEPKQPKVIYKNCIVRNPSMLNTLDEDIKCKSDIDSLTRCIEVISIEKDFIVVNKPSGLASHPNPNCLYYTLTKTLEAIFGLLSCVNRLDVPTSGIVILSKNRRLHELMKNHKIQKTYLALVCGRFEDQIVERPLKKIYGKGSVVSVDGKASKTAFVCLKYNGTYSLVECTPFTGRTHQIRVHLQSIGHPIVNDKLYGGKIVESATVKTKKTCNESELSQSNQDNEIENFILTEEARSFAYENCEYKNNDIYKNMNSFICLHAYKYQIDDKVFCAKVPSWAHNLLETPTGDLI